MTMIFRTLEELVTWYRSWYYHMMHDVWLFGKALGDFDYRWLLFICLLKILGWGIGFHKFWICFFKNVLKELFLFECCVVRHWRRFFVLVRRIDLCLGFFSGFLFLVLLYVSRCRQRDRERKGHVHFVFILLYISYYISWFMVGFVSHFQSMLSFWLSISVFVLFSIFISRILFSIVISDNFIDLLVKGFLSKSSMLLNWIKTRLVYDW